jgi:orotidine-5'-phosphate decarboxylase
LAPSPATRISANQLSASREPSALTPADRLIIALDFPHPQPAFELVARLEGSVRWFKVGLELYLAAGSPVVFELKRLGYSVFLDLKLHDIPNTVASAVLTASRTGADMLTVHASGGPAMLTAAVEAAATLPEPLQLLAVTVLTSMDRGQLAATGVEGAVEAQVMRLARMAAASGIRGLVCSPEETAALRAAFTGDMGQRMRLVTPGIRPAGAEDADQKRIATPAAAIQSGADMLVVGRPITRAADPLAAALSILDQMQ